MRRDIFSHEHDHFRETVSGFLAKEAVPHQPRWERAGIVDRAIWAKAGRLGFLGLEMDEAYGGGGTTDFRYNAVLGEELARAGVRTLGFAVHNDVVGPYLARLLCDEQKERWLRGFCAGELIGAIAMTEPQAGSDLRGIRATARRDGRDYIVNGQKTFITNGINADLVIVVARTDREAGHKGMSLLVVERGMEGFERGRNLEKIGQKAQDTAELFLSDVRVPRENLLGEEGKGFAYMMQNLPQERLSLALGALASARKAFDETLAYVKERHAFGRTVGSFQHSRFLLAELATELDVAQVYVDRCVVEHSAGRMSATDAAMVKWWVTELQNKVVDRCLQLHGGYGYMLEYPIAKAYVDARVETIYGGATEIMKEIIGRSLGL
jgi:long-chain-acyl-CoA dehydrogenase